MKRIIIIMMIALSANVFGQELDKVTGSKKSKLFFDVKIPEMAFFSDKNLGNGQLQLLRYGLGAEYKFKGNLAVGVDFYQCNNRSTLGNEDWQRKGFSMCPSLKYYLNQDAKLFTSVGSRINRFQETNLTTSTKRESYWQNTLFVGLGYKMYFTKNKHFGGQVFTGWDFLLWETGVEKIDIPSDRGIFFNASLFYSF